MGGRGGEPGVGTRKPMENVPPGGGQCGACQLSTAEEKVRLGIGRCIWQELLHRAVGTRVAPMKGSGKVGTYCRRM